MTTESEIRTFLAASTRPPAECLGTVGNDMTGHFGSYPHQPGSATEAANSLDARGELYTTPCPANAHFDFYHYIENGVDVGHIDYHVGALHYANSSRCTVWLNSRRTVGIYPSWPRQGESRRGWSYQPASLDYMPPLTGLSTASSAESPLTAPATPKRTKGTTMTQVLITTIPAGGLADNNPAVPILKGYVGGSSLTNFSGGVGIIALVGDAPGTPANVQVTQLDQRGNEWAADHTGSLTQAADGVAIAHAARRYEFNAFMALLAAYAAPIAVKSA